MMLVVRLMFLVIFRIMHYWFVTSKRSMLKFNCVLLLALAVEENFALQFPKKIETNRKCWIDLGMFKNRSCRKKNEFEEVHMEEN